MRTLITGACGFVGQYLRKRLAEENVEILGLDLNKDACIEGRYVQCDVLNFSLLEQTISSFQPDRVFHLAGLVHPAESQRLCASPDRKPGCCLSAHRKYMEAVSPHRP